MKATRQQAILNIIRQGPVATQEELAEHLRQLGLEVTQATVSRDIRELRLMKVAEGVGYRYAESAQSAASDVFSRVRRTFMEFVLTIEHSRNLLVIKTSPGTANAVAACIDDAGLANVLATLAGDDVVLVIVRETESVYTQDPAVTELLEVFFSLWNPPAAGQA